MAMPRAIIILTTIVTTLLSATAVVAQFGDSPAATTELTGPTHSSKWKVGVVVDAQGGPCVGLVGTLPIPANWPEQKVDVVEEEISPDVKKVRYRTLEKSVKQMVIEIPRLASGDTAKALVTLDIQRTLVPAPTNTDDLRIPSEIPSEVRPYLNASPYIEVRHPMIVKLAKQLRKPELAGWKQVEAIYDHVRDHVRYENGSLKGALAALRDGTGDCEELTSLFIALCRANKIPARTVWVPDHCYPEFYLENADGEGQWYPCQAAGQREFGTISEKRPILQKGDNFKVPDQKGAQRYVAENLTGGAARGGGKPRVEFIRQLLTDG